MEHHQDGHPPSANLASIEDVTTSVLDHLGSIAECVRQFNPELANEIGRTLAPLPRLFATACAECDNLPETLSVLKANQYPEPRMLTRLSDGTAGTVDLTSAGRKDPPRGAMARHARVGSRDFDLLRVAKEMERGFNATSASLIATEAGSYPGTQGFDPTSQGRYTKQDSSSAMNADAPEFSPFWGNQDPNASTRNLYSAALYEGHQLVKFKAHLASLESQRANTIQDLKTIYEGKTAGQADTTTDTRPFPRTAPKYPPGLGPFEERNENKGGYAFAMDTSKKGDMVYPDEDEPEPPKVQPHKRERSWATVAAVSEWTKRRGEKNARPKEIVLKKNAAPLFKELPAQMKRVVLFSNLRRTVTMADISNWISGGPLVSIDMLYDDPFSQTPSKGSTARVVFKTAAHAASTVLRYRQVTDEGEPPFGDEVTAALHEMYAMDEVICAMSEMPPASRRLVFSGKQILAPRPGMVRLFEEELETVLGPHKVQSVEVLNTGNAIVIFGAVSSAMRIKTYFGSKANNAQRPYYCASVGYARDPCELQGEQDEEN